MPARWPALAVPLLLVACGSSTPTDPGTNNTDPTVATLTIAPGDLAFDALGIRTQLTAVAKNAAGATLTPTILWDVQGSGIASVTTSGEVTAVGNGVDTVLAVAGGVVAKVEVRVAQVPTAVTVSGVPTELTVLGTITPLTATVVDRNNRVVPGVPVTWESSNHTVLAVQGNAVMVAVRPGSAVISASTGALNAQRTVNVTLIGPVGGALVGAEVPCTGGMAGPFPCSNVKLMSYLPVSGLGGSGNVDLNDLWGWVDPLTQREYAIVMRRDGTAFVDVTDPLSPTYLGFLPIPSSANPNIWHDVKVYQNHAFIVADGAAQHGMQVFDLTRLRGVAVPRLWDADAHYTQIASAHNIFINEATGFAYSVGGSSGGTTCGGGLHMINIQAPKNPVFAGCFSDPLTGRAGTGYSHDVQCVVYTGPDATYAGKEICFGSNETAISISNVTNKAAPVAISRATYPAVAYTHQGWLTADLRHFLVNDELDEGNGSVSGTRTLIWDVSDLDDPVLVGQFLGPTTATDHNHYIRGNRMYMSNYQFGLRVVDVSTPTTPVQLGFFDTAPNQPNTPGFGGSWSNYPFFPSGNIVMTSRTEGLFVLRTTN